MPLATVRCRLQRGASNADPVYWSWSVDGATYDETDGSDLATAVLDGIVDTVTAGGSSAFVDMDIDLVECFEAAGGPAYFVQGIDPVIPVGTAVSGCQVLQCAVNELVDTPRGTAVAGRLFVGPLAATLSTVVSNNDKDLCALLMQNVADQLITGGYTLVVISRFLDKVERPAPVGLPVLGFRADNRWDVLKTRRVDPIPDGSEDYPLTPAP